MKRTMIAAASVLAGLSMMLCGCGSGAEPKERADSGIERGSRDMEEQQGKADAADYHAAQDSVGTDNGEAVQESGDTEPRHADIRQDDADAVQEERPAAASLPPVKNTVSLLGDSITTFRGYNPEGYAVFFPDFGEVTTVEETWWQRAADELSLTLYVNGSSSGATVAGDSTGTEDPACSCNELRTGALLGPEGACPESIIVYLGANDMINGVPLGTNDGTTPVREGEVPVFSDAYTLMLDKLQAKYPAAEIYCCTLPPVGLAVESAYVDYVNSDGNTTAEYSTVIARIAENKGLSVINLQDCGITIDNLQEMTSDGVHPTPAGMACIAEAVREVLAAGKQ